VIGPRTRNLDDFIYRLYTALYASGGSVEATDIRASQHNTHPEYIHRHAALTSRNGPFAKSVITHHYLVTLALFNNKLRSLRV